jgi:hypothetical protein
MADEVKVWANPRLSTVTVQVNGKNVVLGFFTEGTRVRLRVEQGKLVPQANADYYVTMAQGSPIDVERKDHVLDEILTACDEDRVTWELLGRG